MIRPQIRPQLLWHWRAILLMWVLSSPLSAQTLPETPSDFRPPPTPDVRLVIDISGSMKQNDPNNLRRPALELLVQLLPEGSRAGVWTFGQWVNNLVPSRPVIDVWRENAARQAQKINSAGLYTNIPAAIESAMQGAGMDATHQTHLILLTDGMVDISKNAEEDAAARQRLLEVILPKLRDKGVKVHTIALSGNADSELMERLALETDGLAAVAESAEDLTRIFLQALDAAAPAEEVPLEGNRFLVDSSIDEFTALVFKKDATELAVLIGPDNQKYSKDSHSDDVRWFSQHNYDLITVKQPYEGEWMIQADLEPNSRVTIVSNLSLLVNRLPKGHFIGNEVTISAVLKEQGEVIARPEFLELVDLSYEVVRHGDGERWTQDLSSVDAPPADGVFSAALSVFEQPGVYDVIVTANGKTFQRQQSQTIEARRNFVVNVRATDDSPPHHVLTVVTKNPQIDADSLRLTATFKGPLGADSLQTLTEVSERRWQTEFNGGEQSANYEVELDIVGLYRDGRPLRTRELIELEHVVPGTEFVQPEPEPAPELPTPEPEPKSEPQPVAQPQPEAESIDWAQIGLYVGLVVGNLLVLALGYFAYRTIAGGGGSEILEAEDDVVVEELAGVAAPIQDADSDFDDDIPALDDLEAEIEPTAGEDRDDTAPADSDKDEDETGDSDDILDLPDDAIDIDPEKP